MPVDKTKETTLKLLYVLDGGCNTAYLTQCIERLRANGNIKVRTVTLRGYLRDDRPFDVLIYQTFPCDRIDPATGRHHPKYDHKTISQTDAKFLEEQRPKLLFDANDGCDDGFSRLSPAMPRIKNCPTEEDMRRFNIVMATTHPIDVMPVKAYEKTNTICYCGVSYHSNPVRVTIRDILAGVPNVRYDEIHKRQYRDFLGTSAVVICPPGYSQTTFRHLQTLNAGSLMFAMPGLRQHRLLPYANLVPGEDYVEFVPQELPALLGRWCADKERAASIAANGQRKFLDGYSIPRASTELLRVLKGAVGCGK